MAKKQEVSIPVIRRLPRYYRLINRLISDGAERVSSKELSERLGFTASQIRQDLNCFGGFGQQGYGYNLAALKEEIGKILGLDKKIKTIIVGAGNIGKAVGRRMDFYAEGFEIVGVFDAASEVVGKNVGGFSVKNAELMEETCLKEKVKAAIICVSDESAKKVVQTLIELGVCIFWNFTHYDIAIHNPDKNIAVENVHLNDSLMTLRYLSKDILN